MFLKHLKPFETLRDKYIYNAVLESKALFQKTDFGKFNAIVRWILLNTKYVTIIEDTIIDKYGFKESRADSITQPELFCSMCKLCSLNADEIFCVGCTLVIIEIDNYWYEFDIVSSRYFPEESKNKMYDYLFYHIGQKYYDYVPTYGYQFVKIDKLKAGNATTLCFSIRKAGFTKENGYSIWDIADMFLTDYW